MAYTGIPMWRRIRYFFSNRVRLIIGLIVAVGLVVLIDDFLPNGILGRQKALDRAEAICIQEYIAFSNPILDRDSRGFDRVVPESKSQTGWIFSHLSPRPT